MLAGRAQHDDVHQRRDTAGRQIEQVTECDPGRLRRRAGTLSFVLALAVAGAAVLVATLAGLPPTAPTTR